MAIIEHSAHNSNGMFKRTPTVPLIELPGALPSVNIPEDVDLEGILIPQIQQLTSIGINYCAVGAFWRDTLALTGTMRTFHGAELVAEAWKETSKRHHPTDFCMTPQTASVVRLSPQSAWIDAHFTFRTTGIQPFTTCSGIISLVANPEGLWKIWMLRTTLERLQGHGDVDVLHPRTGLATDNITFYGTNDGSARNDTKISPEINGTNGSHNYDCVVVGGGQAGLSTAGRLHALGLSYVVVDKHPQVGDSWNFRYDSVKLHTAKEYGHLPFDRTFGPEYPEFLTKGQLASGYQNYVRKYGINIWSSTELLSASWHKENRIWTCNLRRQGEEQSITACHLVFAIGAGSQYPIMPKYAKEEFFEGTILHSVDYRSASQWKGKRGIIIGSANTGHDVAEDMLEAGLSSVTMVQRGPTWVLPVEDYLAVTTPLYNKDIPTEIADRISFSSPIVVQRLMAMRYLHPMAEASPERYDALERVGFRVHRYGDIAHIIYERLGGHYMDVGCSEKISKGLIKVKSDATPTHYTATGLAFSDGTEINADVIIFTTGFLGNMRQLAGTIVGPEIENQLEDFWGLDKEGEPRGAFKPTGHPGIWYIGGTVGHARYYSRFVALQIQAALLGTPLGVYNRTPT